MQIRVLLPTGEVKTMDLEDYLLGVVPAEMPALWPLAALKAQAVAARSWALHKMMHGGRHKIVGADVCTGTHCQVYLDVYYIRQDFMDNVYRAVTETAGMVLTYEGRVCDACFHNKCGGHTLSSKDAPGFGGDFLYLTGVECPCGTKRDGHGIGMCQWGARAMATPDCVGMCADWQGILSHYYTGAVLAGIGEVVKGIVGI